MKNIDESFWDIDYLIPVPLHYTRIKKRGYNQSEEIAKEISKKRGLPVLKNLLLRTRETTPQSTLQKEARLLNIKNAFGINKFSNYRKLAGKKFVVVDDVFTTGSTINECAKVLHALEPSSIKAVTVARGA